MTILETKLITILLKSIFMLHKLLINLFLIELRYLAKLRLEKIMKKRFITFLFFLIFEKL